MTRPASIRLEYGGSGILLEYVRRRRALRLTGWHESGAEIAPLELPVDELLVRLGVAADRAGAPRYLVFTGIHGAPRGGAADVAGTYVSEAAARKAFHELRDERAAGMGWAELAVIDGAGRLRTIGWFGRDGDRRTSGLGRRSGVGRSPSTTRRWIPRALRSAPVAPSEFEAAGA